MKSRDLRFAGDGNVGRQRLALVLGCIFVVLVLVISVIGIVLNNVYSATVSIMVVPSSASVSIRGVNEAEGGMKFSAMGEHKIQPGEYAVEISAEGFNPKTGVLNAVSGETAKVYVYLEPTDALSDYYATHPDDALILGEMRNAEAVSRLSELSEANPILKELPIEVDYYTSGYAKHVRYTISYVLNDEVDGFYILVTDFTGGNYGDAISKLAARGADGYEIRYVDESEGGLNSKAF